MRLRGTSLLCDVTEHLGKNLADVLGNWKVVTVALRHAFVHTLPQMAVLEIQSNGDSSYVSQEAINSAIQSLEDPLQRVSPSATSTSHRGGNQLHFLLLSLHLLVCRSLSRSVWRWIPVSDQQRRSSCSIKPCLRCRYSSCWLPTASSATSVSGHAPKHTLNHVGGKFCWGIHSGVFILGGKNNVMLLQLCTFPGRYDSRKRSGRNDQEHGP